MAMDQFVLAFHRTRNQVHTFEMMVVVQSFPVKLFHSAGVEPLVLLESAPLCTGAAILEELSPSDLIFLTNSIPVKRRIMVWDEFIMASRMMMWACHACAAPWLHKRTRTFCGLASDPGPSSNPRESGTYTFSVPCSYASPSVVVVCVSRHFFLTNGENTATSSSCHAIIIEVRQET